MTEQAISFPQDETQNGFAAALRRPVFVALWLSEALSLVGDRLIVVALVMLVYECTRSPAAVGILMMLKAIPSLAMGSIAGVFVDRWDRKWVMVGSNLIQGLLVLMIPFSSTLLPVYVIYFAMAVVNQFFTPARAATIPNLVPPQALLAANSLFAGAFVGALAVGPIIGGWLTDRFGTDVAFYVDAVTFLVPALAVGMLAIPRQRSVPAGRALGVDLREGIRYVRSRADVIAALTLMPAAFLVIGTLSVLGVVIMRENLNVGASGYGALMSAMGGGMLCGAIGIGWLGRRFNRTWLGAAGAGLTALTVMAMPWVGQFYLVLIFAVFTGLGMVAVQVTSQTVLQSVPENLRGRVMGLSQALMGGAQFLATALAGLLAEWLGAAIVLIGAGMASLAAGVAALIIYRRGEGKS